MSTAIACRTALDTREARWHELCASADWCDCGCHGGKWRVAKIDGSWWAFQPGRERGYRFASWKSAIAFVGIEIREGSYR